MSHIYRTVEVPCAYLAVVGGGKGYSIGRADVRVPGYTPVPEEGTFTSYKSASDRADEINRSIGLLPDVVTKIVLSTMPKPKRFLVTVDEDERSVEVYGPYADDETRSAELANLSESVLAVDVDGDTLRVEWADQDWRWTWRLASLR